MKYRHLVIEETSQQASDLEIKSIEDELGVSLPNDYKAFLKSCNGGYLEYDVLINFDNEDSEYLSFSSLYRASRDDDWECNPFELRQAKKQAGFPEMGVIPIARDGGSSMLYLDMREGYKVVAFVQGLPEWTGLRQKDALVVVAESFDDYLSQLTISDEMIKDHIEHFDISEASVNATVEWFDSIGPQWRDKFREQWNQRVPFYKV